MIKKVSTKLKHSVLDSFCGFAFPLASPEVILTTDGDDEIKLFSAQMEIFRTLLREQICRV